MSSIGAIPTTKLRARCTALLRRGGRDHRCLTSVWQNATTNAHKRRSLFFRSRIPDPDFGRCWKNSVHRRHVQDRMRHITTVRDAPFNVSRTCKCTTSAAVCNRAAASPPHPAHRTFEHKRRQRHDLDLGLCACTICFRKFRSQSARRPAPRFSQVGHKRLGVRPARPPLSNAQLRNAEASLPATTA